MGKETDRKWEEGDEISLLDFSATEYGRRGKVVASEEVKDAIQKIGINRCGAGKWFPPCERDTKADSRITNKAGFVHGIRRLAQTLRAHTASLNGQL